ncbi:MAG: lysoplasmalogenase [Candidatus Hydrogenedentes bacterium]|nr:lysoplasmalogenase [Candidatus Hydrogenedentota bacterium]
MLLPVQVTGLIAVALGLACALLVAYLRVPGKLLGKMVASTGFVAVGIGSGCLESTYGRIVLVALGLCWIGDYLLTLTGEVPFLIGLVAFLLAHLALFGAFWVHGLNAAWCAGAAVAAVLVAAVVLRWLYSKLPDKMRIAVLAYMAVISVMVILALGVRGAGGPLWIPVGAVTFYVSDLFVARQSFVSPGYSNDILGLPLYYGAVTMLALSVASQLPA